MVLFYHYCQYANKVVYSMYLDSTQELCAENAQALNHTHQHTDSCCNHSENTEDGCCKNHRSDQKTVKIKSEYNFPDRQSTPRPIALLLFNTDAPIQVDYIRTSFIYTGLLKELPAEIPIAFASGKKLVTLLHSLKIAC